MKNKGFTLVELIAVIAIIGVFIILMVPFMSNVFGRTKKMINDIDRQALEDSVKTYLTNLQNNGYQLNNQYVYDDQCNIQDVLSNYDPVSYRTSDNTEVSGYDFVKYAAQNDLYITAEFLVNNNYFDSGCNYVENSCPKSTGCKVNKECTLVVHYESEKVLANPNCTLGDRCEFYYQLGNYTINILDESKCAIK
jgi:prepilin-type N-terminal cleavage/methylation domain-containing protein